MNTGFQSGTSGKLADMVFILTPRLRALRFLLSNEENPMQIIREHDLNRHFVAFTVTQVAVIL